MAIWYEVEKTQSGMKDFMECNWDFHDFTVERITYMPDSDLIEMFLKYDELEGSVLLRFIDVVDFRIVPRDRDYSSELMGSVIALDESDFLTWVADDSYPAENVDEAKKYATWIKSGKIIWTVTNAQGMPDEMPSYKIDQQWKIYGKTVEKHFSLKEYKEDFQKYNSSIIAL